MNMGVFSALCHSPPIVTFMEPLKTCLMSRAGSLKLLKNM
jgi:hypothetical protein